MESESEVVATQLGLNEMFGDSLLSLIAIISICVVFGSFGGLVSHFVNNEKSPEYSGTDQKILTTSGNWFSFPSLFQSACIGTAGALGFLFFITAVGGITTSFDSLQEHLRTISSSVIAGFGARSLLPKMAGQLEKQVAEARSKADEAVHEVRSNEERLALLECNMRLVQAANSAASAASRQEALSLADAIIEKGHESSATWIAYARVQRWAGETLAAIYTLSKGISKMEAKKVDEKNLSAAYYNRACYQALEYKKTGDPQTLTECFADLRKFFDMSVDKQEEANFIWSDEDWTHLHKEPRLTEIIGPKP